MRDLDRKYRGKAVLITGGLGFMGSNLSSKLLELGAKVALTDNRYSEGWQNLIGNSEGVTFEVADIRDETNMKKLVKGKDYLFNLAGLSGAVESNQASMLHFEVNCAGHLNVLEICRSTNPGIRVFFPSSQLVYGSVKKNPVREDYPTEPKSIYGVHKLTGEHHYRLYYDLYGLRTSILRISNPYGPQQVGEHTYGIVNYFISLATKGQPITIFGEGRQIRDYLYIDDLVEAILISTSSEQAYGKIYNVGGRERIALIDMAKLIVRLLGEGEIKLVPWPKDAKKTEVGDIFLDKSKIKRELNWEAKTSLEEGIRKTIQWYQ